MASVRVCECASVRVASVRVASGECASGGLSNKELFTVHCPLSTVHCPLSTVHCSLPTVLISSQAQANQDCHRRHRRRNNKGLGQDADGGLGEAIYNGLLIHRIGEG